MYTIEDYLDQLVLDKASLVSNLEAKGVTASSEETFTTLVPKVLDITIVNNETTSINITSNGTQTITPSSGYTGIGSLTINTSVTPNLQSKSVTISSNTTTSISADTGYQGLSSVSVTTNVPTGVSAYFGNTLTSGTSQAAGWLQLVKALPSGLTITGTNGSNAFAYLPFEDTTFLNDLDTSNITLMYGFFYYSTKIKQIPALNTSSVISFSSFCMGCQDLITIPILNTTNCTDFKDAFRQCLKIETFPLWDTSNGTDFSRMFQGCVLLKNIPQLSFAKATTLLNVFNGCNQLTDDSINNILASCTGATQYNGTKTLATLGFSSSYYPASRIQALSNYTAFTTAGWSIGYN